MRFLLLPDSDNSHQPFHVLPIPTTFFIDKTASSARPKSPRGQGDDGEMAAWEVNVTSERET